MRRFELTVEEGLVLVEGTKVFKAAAFAPARSADLSTDDYPCDARLSDSQNPFTATGPAAYFAARFLGVSLEAEPRVLTERIFRGIETYINTEMTDPAKRVAAERALLVEMDSQKQTFSARQFANQHLDAADRQPLIDHLKAGELPTQATPKDLELIQSKLKIMSLELDGRITVVGPEDKFDGETIKVAEGDGDLAVVTIKAGLRSTRSRGR